MQLQEVLGMLKFVFSFSTFNKNYFSSSKNELQIRLNSLCELIRGVVQKRFGSTEHLFYPIIRL